MRAAFWLLALFSLAVGVALFAGNNDSTITIFWPPYRIDLSLNFVIVGLLGLFFVLHAALRGLAALFAMPGEARRWRLIHKERALQVALVESLSNLLAGRFLRARKAAESILMQEKFLSRGDESLPYAPRLRAMAHLLVAESAHALQDKPVRDLNLKFAVEAVGKRDGQEAYDGAQLRAAHWALHDHDAAAALRRLDELPVGTSRRTLALRLRLRAARMSRRTVLALETARLLAKHGAFSASVAQGVLRSQALELLASAHDDAQLEKAWAQLDAAEQAMPEVATAAAERLLLLGGDVKRSRQWLLPVWDRLLADLQGAPIHQRSRVVQILESGFAMTSGAPDVEWLTRIESAQLSHPGEPLLQYLAGVSCLHLQLWGKAQHLLKQSLSGLKDSTLRRNAWRHLAELAQRRGDEMAAAEAYKSAAKV